MNYTVFGPNDILSLYCKFHDSESSLLNSLRKDSLPWPHAVQVNKSLSHACMQCMCRTKYFHVIVYISEFSHAKMSAKLKTHKCNSHIQIFNTEENKF